MHRRASSVTERGLAVPDPCTTSSEATVSQIKRSRALYAGRYRNSGAFVRAQHRRQHWRCWRGTDCRSPRTRLTVYAAGPVIRSAASSATDVARHRPGERETIGSVAPRALTEDSVEMEFLTDNPVA